MKKKRPALRFSGFDNDWEQRKLGDVAVRGSKVRRSSSEFPSVEYEDVVAEEGRLNKEIRKKKTNKDGIAFDGTQILYGKLRPYLHNWFNPDFCGVAVGDWWVLKPIMIDKGFLYRLIQTQKFDDIANQSSGSKMPRADWNLVANSEFMLSKSREEQSKIGAYFCRLDHLITLHQCKCKKLICIKKSMLENMFPQKGEKIPRIRFSGFTDDWEQRKLGDVADKVIEKNADLTVQETFTNSAEFGVVSQRDFFDHDITNVDNIGGYYVVKNEDFVYNPRISVTAPVGPVNRNKLGRDGVISPLYTVFRTHDIDTIYLDWFFKSGYWHSFMYFNGDSGARSDRFSIKDSVFFEMPIPMPTLKEQRKIGAWMDGLDHLITLHQRELEKLQNIKKAMLEKMFV